MEKKNFKLVTVVVLVLNLVILYYVVKLETEKCVCSTMWQRDFIKYFTLVYLLYIVLLMVSMNVFGKYLFYVASLMSVLAFVNVYAIFTYIRALAERDCRCATEGDNYNYYLFTKYFNYLQILMLVVGVLGGVMMIVSVKKLETK